MLISPSKNDMKYSSRTIPGARRCNCFYYSLCILHVSFYTPAESLGTQADHTKCVWSKLLMAFIIVVSVPYPYQHQWK